MLEASQMGLLGHCIPEYRENNEPRSLDLILPLTKGKQFLNLDLLAHLLKDVYFQIFGIVLK